mmetsp:Transcript_3081/g.6574  ORF Transcript_3081/g.6574 Transcript_3081/m.6574 type:complete len:314 (+) Transcript_3081:256-1197(+)
MLQRLLHRCEHVPRVRTAILPLGEDEVKDVDGLHPCSEDASHQRPTAGAAEADARRIRILARTATANAHKHVLGDPVRHTEMVAHEPPTGVEGERHPRPARCVSFGPGLLVVPVHEENKPARNDAKVKGNEAHRQMPPPSGEDIVDGAEHVLQDLHLENVRLLEERHGTKTEEREAQVQVDYHLAQRTDHRREVGVAAASKATSEVPTPEIQHAVVEVEEGDRLKALPEHHEGGAKEFKLPAVILQPDEASQRVAARRGVPCIAPCLEAKRLRFTVEAEAAVEVQQALRAVVDQHALEEQPTYGSELLHAAHT